MAHFKTADNFLIFGSNFDLSFLNFFLCEGAGQNTQKDNKSHKEKFHDYQSAIRLCALQLNFCQFIREFLFFPKKQIICSHDFCVKKRLGEKESFPDKIFDRFLEFWTSI
jgi:hypothetical protein